MIEDEKIHLRHRMRTLRAEAAARDPDAAEKLASVFPMKLLERYGPVVSSYVPINEELDPMPLIERLERAGAEICLPRLTPAGISWRLWSPGEPLERRGFGLLEPPEDAPEATPTLVLTPLLAYDLSGNRLGYGRGHYDQALAALRARGRAFACALAYAAQQIDRVPAEAHDEPLDWAVTPEGSVPLFMLRNRAAFAGPDPDGGSAA
jgi:5-formyltetrahydrofolate cyclo-ligase